MSKSEEQRHHTSKDNHENKLHIREGRGDKTRNFDRVDTASSSTIKKSDESRRLSSNGKKG